MSESPAASGRPDRDGRTGANPAPANAGEPAPDAPAEETSTTAGSQYSIDQRSTEEGNREVRTSEDQGSTGSAVREPEAAQDAATGAGDAAEASGAGGTAGATRVRELPRSLTFHLTRTSLLAVFVVVICTTPIAFAEPFPYLLLAYAIPLALAYAVLHPRTVVSAEGVRTRLLLGETSFRWEQLESLRLDERRWLRAVLDSGEQVRLTAIRVRDLPHLARMSGGRLPDPNEPLAEEPVETADAEETAAPEETADAGTGNAAIEAGDSGETPAAPGETERDSARSAADAENEQRS